MKRNHVGMALVLLGIMVFLVVGCIGKEQAGEGPEEPGLVEENRETAEGDTGEDKQADESSQSVEQAKKQLPGALLVMVDNFSKARPQSGLDQADLVYEIVAEGGITRFMALFYRQGVEKIGPIRSARSYFAQLARGYNAPLAHAGGSAEALNLIVKIKMKDLDEIYNSGAYFWRDKQRKMPHNLYSSTDKLQQGAKNRGYSLEAPFLQPTGTAWEGEPFTGEFELDYSVPKYSYKVTWQYKNKQYERKINGKPHLMEDGTQLMADNVLVMAVKTSTYMKDGIPLSDVQIVGQGEARFFIDGQKLQGSWEKKSDVAAVKFYDEKGDLLKLKKGKTWIQVVPQLKKIKEKEAL